ncbi:MAG: nucleoside triphosphate pyrophosphohydrolase [Rickettsiales bacterium]|nr:nucleoside triphosphate pyrophosphohydrolase [Rickettsiales bacterium]
MIRKFKTDILVRNNRIKMMEEHGVIVNYSILSDEEYIKGLKKKIIEEANEVATAPNLEELMGEIGDLLEVIEHIVDVHKLDKEKIQEYKKIKQEKVGKFDKKFKTHWVEIDDTNNPTDYYKSAAYYLANPNKYPEIK